MVAIEKTTIIIIIIISRESQLFRPYCRRFHGSEDRCNTEQGVKEEGHCSLFAVSKNIAKGGEDRTSHISVRMETAGLTSQRGNAR